MEHKTVCTGAPPYFKLKAASWLRSALTALPLRVAHPQVTAHTSRALLGTVRAADLLDLLGQGLQGGVDLHVTVAHHVGVVSAVMATTVGIGCLLLNRLADEVESATRRSRGSSRSRRSGRTLFEEIRYLQNADTIHKRLKQRSACNSQQGPSLHCDHEVQGGQWVQADRSCHPYQEHH